MLLLGPLVLVVIIVGVVVAVRSSRTHRRSPPPPAVVPRGMGVAGPTPGVADDLARWRAAGLLSGEQEAAILAYEEAAGTTPRVAARPPMVAHRRSTSVVAEAVGYIGGMLATIGLVLLVARYWTDMATAGRLALSAAGAVGLLGAGALVHARAAPALARLQGFLWLASTAATTLFMGVLTVDGFGAGETKTVVLACVAAVAVESGVLWWWRDRAIQELSFLVGAAACAGAVTAELAAQGPVGLTVWAVGVALLASGLRRLLPRPILAEGAGAVAVIVGGTMAATGWQGFGLALLVATAFALLAVATVPGPAPQRADQLTIGIFGALALLEAVPSTVGYFSHRGGGATGLVAWGIGGLLVVAGARRFVRLAVVAEVLGGVAIVGGAAITWLQWHGFAPVFGIVTAIGLLALGMLPEQVLLSMFGSLGLLVNVPWAIGWFFPGQGRAPLLILVSGALILVIAVLLSRRHGPLRRDLAAPRHRRPPSSATGVPSEEVDPTRDPDHPVDQSAQGRRSMGKTPSEQITMSCIGRSWTSSPGGEQMTLASTSGLPKLGDDSISLLMTATEPHLRHRG